MAFTQLQLPVSRQKQFQFFASDGDSAVAPDAEFTESLAPSYAFELEKIKLRLSTAHVSVVDFMVTVSHHLGSYYDQNVLSQAMNGVRDVVLQLNPTLKLHSGDTLRFSLIMSAVNTYGIEVTGWSITEVARA
jgi:hypothetical protein